MRKENAATVEKQPVPYNIKPKVQDFSLLLSPSETAIYTVHAICFLLF